MSTEPRLDRPEATASDPHPAPPVQADSRGVPMPDDGPRTDVLAERLDGFARRLDTLDTNVRGLATREELIGLIKSRDEIAATRMDALSQDIREVVAALATERAERQAAVEAEKRDRQKASTEEKNERQVAVGQVETSANNSRRFALGAIALAITLMLGLVGLIAQLGGAPV